MSRNVGTDPKKAASVVEEEEEFDEEGWKVIVDNAEEEEKKIKKLEENKKSRRFKSLEKLENDANWWASVEKLKKQYEEEEEHKQNKTAASAAATSDSTSTTWVVINKSSKMFVELKLPQILEVKNCLPTDIPASLNTPEDNDDVVMADVNKQLNISNLIVSTSLPLYLDNYELLFDSIDKTIQHEQWKSINGRTDMGCGLNCLVYLKIITRTVGEDLLSKIKPTGTSFFEIMSVIYNQRITNITKKLINLIEYELHLNFRDATIFQGKWGASYASTIMENLLKINQLLQPGTCTIVKYNKDSSVGHTVIFFKKTNGDFGFIDPLTSKTRIIDGTNIDKIFKYFGVQRIISFSLILKEKSIVVPIFNQTKRMIPRQNTISDTIATLTPIDLIDESNSLNILTTNILIFKLNLQKLQAWVPCGSQTNCTIEVFGLLGLIDDYEEGRKATELSAIMRGTYASGLIEKKTGLQISQSIVMKLNELDKLLLLLDFNNAIYCSVKTKKIPPRNESIHHSIIICCMLYEGEKTLFLIDPQMTIATLNKQSSRAVSCGTSNIVIIKNISTYLFAFNFEEYFIIPTLNNHPTSSSPIGNTIITTTTTTAQPGGKKQSRKNKKQSRKGKKQSRKGKKQSRKGKKQSRKK